MRLAETQKKKILASLKPVNPEKVILFGSYAWGEPFEDSDIDLYIVTKDEFIPKNFSEKLEIKYMVVNHLKDFRKKYSTDIIVHTKAMHEKFIKLNSAFARKLMSKGIELQ